MIIQLHSPQAIQELGKRKNQEDAIYPLYGEATASDRVFLVCDGMGGYDKGEVASAAVCRGMSQATQRMLAEQATFTDEQFQTALTEAFDTLDAADSVHEGKMGTTMTFLCLHKGGCLAAHLGDSRIYHLRPQTGEVRYRSRDHSLVQQLYELGEISYNDMATHPRRNIILRAMQPFQEERSKATLVHITDLQPGDYLYICSDGMLEQMDDDELLGILSAPLTDEEKAQELIRRTAYNSDNHSAYLIRIKDVQTEPGDELLLSDEEEARRGNKALNDPHKDQAWDAGEEVNSVVDIPDNAPAATTATPSTAAAPATKKKPAVWQPVLAVAMVVAIAIALKLLFA
jgi:protein phosphatase